MQDLIEVKDQSTNSTPKATYQISWSEGIIIINFVQKTGLYLWGGTCTLRTPT